MFFVTILLNEVLAWVRSQPGTSSLRAILYMDEIFGYFPPTANPPSKVPMLTLLKQARAYGLGVVLATQNPVDLDYKGLSNAGTWFLGRLQTQRDKDRVLEGLEGASTAAGHAFDRSEMDKILSGLGSRVFVMNNVHDDQPVVFQTRWTLSYLRGPLTREQIQTLMAARKPAMVSAGHPMPAAVGSTGSPSSSAAASTSGPSAAGARPVVPPDVPVFFVPRRGPLEPGESLAVSPCDSWAWPGCITPTRRLASTTGRPWPCSSGSTTRCRRRSGPAASRSTTACRSWTRPPRPAARFAPLPSELARAKCYAEWTKSLKNYLYRERTLDLWSCPELKELSRPTESEREFRLRLAQASREQRDQEVEKLRAKYAPKQSALEDQIRRARERLEREQAQASRSTWDATIAMGSSVLGALLGRKTLSKTNVTKAASAAKAAGRAAQQHGEVGQAGESLEVLRRKYAELEAKFQAEVAKLDAPLRPEAAELKPMPIRPKKADITVEQVVLAWTPWKVGAEGKPEAAY